MGKSGARGGRADHGWDVMYVKNKNQNEKIRREGMECCVGRKRGGTEGS